ncbi:class I SAM-dependent methyltransferase [Cryptosporangium japonicum]|uniref:Methyltransferase type 11 domain-containing protein n=1 Tax=Cryptosporangium japonicum TaxID=80872 RepID=A0ABN0UTI2_9ACTN
MNERVATTSGSGSSYKFGDTDLAATRLRTVAQVFEHSSRDFITGAVDRPIGLAVDLGSGPGYTTRIVAESTRAANTVGLDSSPSFLAAAAADTSRPGLVFHQHDVTIVPFPVGPADLLYCRFLLSHLTDPDAVLTRWAGQLADGGLLLIDEVEYVRTDHPVLAFYQQVVTTLLGRNNQLLEIGSTLARMSAPPRTERLESALVTVRPAARDIGTMFLLNLSTWRRDTSITEIFSSVDLDRLEADLSDVAEGRLVASAEWGMRQILYRRVHE